MKKRFWITWENHRRSRELANAFKAEYVCLTHPGERVIRYPVLMVKTLYFLIKIKPKILFCQNPSIALNALLCFFKPVFKYKLISDRHTNFKFHTISSRNLKWRVFQWLSHYTIRCSDITIVTNSFLKDYVDRNGGKGFVLPDKLPKFQVTEKSSLKGIVNFVFVCTFSDDEPVMEIIEAARKLNSDSHIYITGSFKKYHRLQEVLERQPKNVTLTGFLPEEDYQKLLVSADALIVITNQEHTLTCGAYEAVALEKPMLLGNTQTIRNYFSWGAYYTDMSINDISKKLTEMEHGLEDLKSEVVRLKSVLQSDWNEKFLALEEIL